MNIAQEFELIGFGKLQDPPGAAREELTLREIYFFIIGFQTMAVVVVGMLIKWLC